MDDNYNDEDIFELQHHHLLQCLEKTTVNALKSHLFIVNINSSICSRIVSSWSWINNLMEVVQHSNPKIHHPVLRRQWQVHHTPLIHHQVFYSHAVVAVALKDIRYLEKHYELITCQLSFL